MHFWLLLQAIAEQYFPRLEQANGLPVTAVDTRGHQYSFKFRYIPAIQLHSAAYYQACNAAAPGLTCSIAWHNGMVLVYIMCSHSSASMGTTHKLVCVVKAA